MPDNELKEIWRRAHQQIEKTRARHDIDEPAWKRVVRSAFTVFFFVIWINAALSAYFYISTYNRHTDQLKPDAVHTQPLTSHGRTVYITPEENARVQFFMRGFMYGIPTAIVLAFVLELSGIGAIAPQERKRINSANQNGDGANG